MSSVVVKLGSLVIKTLSKPIASKIKAQARDHERFRRICVNVAQSIHRWDMRFRLGLLQDVAALERQAAREAAEAQAKKHKHEAPTVKTEAQTKADDAAAAQAKERGEEKAPPKKPKIRPLSEAKAIDSGANFVSETFLLAVGIALILGENWRQGRKATSRREDIAERISGLEDYEKSARKGLVELEREIIRLRAKAGEAPVKQGRILPREVYELEEKEESEGAVKNQGWLSWMRRGGQKAATEVHEVSEATLKALENEKTTTAEKPSASMLSRIFPSNYTSGSEQHKEDPRRPGETQKPGSSPQTNSPTKSSTTKTS